MIYWHPSCRMKPIMTCGYSSVMNSITLCVTPITQLMRNSSLLSLRALPCSFPSIEMTRSYQPIAIVLQCVTCTV